MKVSRLWLEEYSDGLPSTNELVQTFERIGLEVEHVSTFQTDAIVAQVVAVKKHPNADRLQLCTVNIGKNNKNFDIVCGASNVRANMLGAFLPIGGLLPDGTKIVKRSIRGVVSQGMLCSGSEVGLYETDGLLELDGKNGICVGQRLDDIPHLYDTTITLETTPNRPDWLGVYGLARDLQAAGVGCLKPPTKATFDIDQSIDKPVITLMHKACPLFIGRFIRNINPDATTPSWMMQRLKSVGISCVHPVVDITNYVSHGLCRPLHGYDARFIGENGVSVRCALEEEHFEDLDGREHNLKPYMHVVAQHKKDNKGTVLALGGIIGGSNSRCREDTTDIFLESAWFEPSSVGHTARTLGIDTDARRRFERGVDPQTTAYGCNLATHLILRYCGGKAGDLVQQGEPPPSAPRIAFDASLVKQYTGMTIPLEEVSSILKKLGFGKTQEKGKISYDIPTWRPDIQGSADLVEEIIRIKGIDHCPPVPLPPLDSCHEKSTETKASSGLHIHVGRILAARGFCEVLNWSFLQEEDEKYAPSQQQIVRLENPIDESMSIMRYSLLPGLLRGLAVYQKQGGGEVRFFETGNAFSLKENRKEQAIDVVQTPYVSGLIYAPLEAHWLGEKILGDNPSCVRGLLEDVLYMLSHLGYKQKDMRWEKISESSSFFHPNKSAKIYYKDTEKIILTYGEVHPEVCDYYAIDKNIDKNDTSIVAFEASLLPRMRHTKDEHVFSPSLPHPTSWDVSFIWDKKKFVGNLIKKILENGQKHHCTVDVFDYFTEHDDDTQVVLSLKITMRPNAREKKPQNIFLDILQKTCKETGAKIKGMTFPPSRKESSS